MIEEKVIFSTIKQTKSNLKMNEETSQKTNDYKAESIQVLSGLEPVRKRPGMFIGSTDARGLHHIVFEVVDNSVDEALAGHCNKIIVTIHADGSASVKDNGRGIPVDIHPKEGVSALQVVMTILHAGGKFERSSYKVSGGLHGVGVSVTNALSKKLIVQVMRDGKIYQQEYERGKPVYAVKIIGDTNERGTLVQFYPDPEIFETLEFKFEILASRLKELGYLNKGLEIVLFDERDSKKEIFKYDGGIKELIENLNKSKEKISPTIYLEKEKDGITAEVAFQYVETYDEKIFSFANNINTHEGGTHLTGFRTALTRSLNNYAEKNNFTKETKLSSEDFKEGLVAVVSIKIPNPQFEGQTKTKLGNSEVKGIVDTIVNDFLSSFLMENPSVSKQIIMKAINAAQAREAARKAKDLVRRKSIFEGSTLPGKLADCSSNDPKACELYLVEGDSAGGCFSRDTKIALVDGRNLSFIEIIEENKNGKKNFCYTIMNNGKIGIQEIKNPRKTKTNTVVIKIILDNNEEIVCTPDHLFMTRDYSFKPVKDLTNNDSIMPLNRVISERKGKITIKGYEMVWNPLDNKYIFTHLLADEYNLKQKIYTKNDGSDRHHKDFNKLNNYPNNIIRMKKEEHMALHMLLAEKNFRNKEVIEKLNALRKTPEFREKIRNKILNMRDELSKRAKLQWENSEYKKYMMERFLSFYTSNKEYRDKNLKTLNDAQRQYWSQKDNRVNQSERIKDFFKEHPEVKKLLSEKAKKQWEDKDLKVWRSQKTKQQWTDDFRAKRKIAYNKVYYDNTIKMLRKIYDVNKSINKEEFDKLRKECKNKNVLSYNTFADRFFQNDESKIEEAVANYNHKIKEIIWLKEKIDVYDIEVPETHNFALASGIFVHNSAKQGRKRDYQAILPLKGKILNVEKSRLVKVLKNEEITSMIIAIGTGIGDEFDINKLRYHKIVIMTDADVDGNHIACLLLTFFYRYMNQLIEAGKIYLAQPPLYKMQKGRKVVYAYNDEEKAKVLQELGEDVGIQRYKGLGEMNASQLWETTMDPKVRTLKQIRIEDAISADETFSMLMGDDVAPRKQFILDHAKEVEELDV